MSMRLPKGNMSILDFQDPFDTEEKCWKFFIRLRYLDGFVCPHCGGTKCGQICTRNLLRCKSCRKQISVTSGTVFHCSHLSLKQLIWAMYLFANDKRGCSAVQLHRMLKVNYDTAYFILQRLEKPCGIGMTATCSKDMLQHLHTAISNMKVFLNGTYHGVTKAHLQEYLNEFDFRYNRRKFGEHLFERLAIAVFAR